jgi:5-deoxy-glucuronate isomerase
VFSGPTDFAYVGRDSGFRVVSASGARVALCGARARRRLPFRYGSAEDVPIELRGAGCCSREVHNFATADVFEADSIIACEVITPGGNWSSYPPHKHDDATTIGEAELEEIYYYRIQGESGFGVHRTYTADRSIDETITVRDGDVCLVPRGYHGPCVAPPEFPMYYLNVLAGVSDSRSLGFSDDPAYAWIRETWKTLPRDPRVPLVSAAGAVQ